MKEKFFSIIVTLLLSSVINAQELDNKKVNLNNQFKRVDREMYKFLDLSQSQIEKIEAIKKEEKNFKGKNQQLNSKTLLFMKAVNDENIDKVLTSDQKIKKRKFDFIENNIGFIKDKIKLSIQQEETMTNACLENDKKREAIVNNPAFSSEEVKQKVGELNNEVTKEIQNALTNGQILQLHNDDEKKN